MLFKAIHFKISDDEAGAIPIVIPLACKSKPISPLVIFADQGTLKPSRSVNWDQTFSRKGLPYESYVPMQESMSEITFVRKPTAPTSLPNRVTFDRTAAPEAVLQGDLITVVRDLPVIHVKATGKPIELKVEDDFHKMLSSLVWIVKVGWLAHSMRYCSSDNRATFQRNFIDNFVLGRSLVHLSSC